MKMKFDYFVKVIDKENNELWVTGTEGKYAIWEAGKEALKMSKDMAEDIAIGLICNLIPAYVVASVKDIFEFKNE